MTNPILTPDMHKQPIKMLNNQRNCYENGLNAHLTRSSEDKDLNEFNFTLELYSYEETEIILVDILSQVSRSNHLMEFLANSIDFKNFIISV